VQVVTRTSHGEGTTTRFSALGYALIVLSVLLGGGASGSSQVVAQGVKVTHIEVAQVIQDPGNSVRLVARKKNTLARVYLEPDGGGAPSGHSVTLTGLLRVVSASGKVFSLKPDSTLTLDPAASVPLRDMHNSLDRTLNFRLPPDVTVAGRAVLSLENLSDPATGAPFLCTGCTALPFSVLFEDVPTLRVRVLGLSYHFIQPGSIAKTPVSSPDEKDYKVIRSWLERAYPASDVEFSAIPVPTGMVLSTDPKISACEFLGTVDLFRADELDDPKNKNLERTHYYALIKDANGRNFIPGCSRTPVIQPQPDAVGVGPIGEPSSESFSLWVSGDTYGDYYTGHEIAHTFGRLHPGKCPERHEVVDIDPNHDSLPDHIGDPDHMLVGYDFGNPDPDPRLHRPFKLLPGDQYTDIMSYCDNEWMSKYTYEHLMDRLIAEGCIYSGSPCGAVAANGLGAENSTSSHAVSLNAVTKSRGRNLGTTGAVAAMREGVARAVALSSAVETSQQASQEPTASSAGESPPQAEPEGAQVDAEFLRRTESGDFLRIFGTVNVTQRTGKFLDPVRAKRIESRVKAADNKPEGVSLKIQYLDGGGKEIGVYYLPLLPTTASDEGEKIMSIRGAVPVKEGVVKINFVLSGGDGDNADKETLLLSKDVGGPSAKVTKLYVLRTQGGPGTDPTKMPFDVRWDVKGADSTVHYRIDVSKDKGVSWELKAPYYPKNSLLLYPDIKPEDGDVQEIWVRVTPVGFDTEPLIFKQKLKE
jgi:hypothetical protein